MHFLELSAYWSDPGDQPNFQTWWMMLENYLYWLDRHASPMDPLNDEDNNWLVYTLLGPEGTSRFASNLMASRMGQASFVEFTEAVKTFFHPSVNPLHAHFDYLCRHQQEGETAAEFLVALRTLLIDY